MFLPRTISQSLPQPMARDGLQYRCAYNYTFAFICTPSIPDTRSSREYVARFETKRKNQIAQAV
jgi:hypothetical protein